MILGVNSKWSGLHACLKCGGSLVVEIANPVMDTLEIRCAACHSTACKINIEVEELANDYEHC